MSQQVNFSVPSVQDAVQPQAAALAMQPSLPTAQTPTTQLDRIDTMLAAQRAQQAQLGLALKAAKTGSTSSARVDASPAWAMPYLGAHAGWFAASGVAVLLLCAGFVVVWRGRFASAPPQPAAQDSLTDSLLMASEYNALQPWGSPAAGAALSQPAPSSWASRVPVGDAQAVDIAIDFDVSEPSGVGADATNSVFHTDSDFVSDEVRKVQQSLAQKRAVRKSQQRVLQPEVLLNTTLPTPEQVLASVFAPLPDRAFDLAPPAPPPPTLREPMAIAANLTDDDAQWTVQLQLAQEMADLGHIEDAQALCQEVFVKGSETMQGTALQIMTRLPNVKQL